MGELRRHYHQLNPDFLIPRFRALLEADGANFSGPPDARERPATANSAL